MNKIERFAEEQISAAKPAVNTLEVIPAVSPLSCAIWVNAAGQVLRTAEAEAQAARVVAAAAFKALGGYDTSSEVANVSAGPEPTVTALINTRGQFFGA
jgi:hypothetical protein